MIIYPFKRRATVESHFTYTRDGVGYIDRGKGCAPKESLYAYTRDGVRDIDRGKGCAIGESLLTYTRDGFGDIDRGKGLAKTESSIAYAHDGVGDSDRGKGIAIGESRPSYTSDKVGDNYFFCSALVLNQNAVFYLCITDKVIVRIICRILRWTEKYFILIDILDTFYFTPLCFCTSIMDFFKRFAIFESPRTYTRD